MTPSEWTRWRLQSSAASFLFFLAAKTCDTRNSATTMGQEFAFFGLRMRRAIVQSLISLHPRQQIR
jgi:hypothetical protein